MKITNALSFTALAFALALPAMNSTAQNLRVRESLDAGWRFTKDDPADAGGNLNYSAAKPWLLPLQNPFTTNAPATAPAENFGGDVSYVQPGFDDSHWRQLNLPHDFGIEGPFEQALPGETGKLPWFGVAWYRKTFDLPADDAGKQIYFDVDGAMAYATVWCNGHCVGGWPYGYASWRVDLTPFVKFGAANTLAIRLDNPKDSSRWYPGGGIYRNVWLVKTSPVHVAQWGTYITTPLISSAEAARLGENTIENQSQNDVELAVETKIFELDANGVKHGDAVATKSAELKLPAGKSGTSAVELTVDHPKLWDIEQPESLCRRHHRQRRTEKWWTWFETPFRHPHDRVHHDRWFSAERRTRAAERRLRSPRPRRARHAPSTRARWSGSWKFCGRWAATPSARAITRPRRSCWTCATAWVSS